MTKILDFLADWYILFIVITILLIFALIGYFVERKRSKHSPFKIASDRNEIEQMSIDNLKSMSSNVSLSEALNKNVITNNNAQNFNNQSPNPQNNINNQNNIQRYYSQPK